MKIIIAGAGEVGTHLAKMLAKENLDTILIDESLEKLDDIQANYDLMTKVGSPTSIEVLLDAEVKDTDLFIAVTPSESVNITACMLATNLGADKTLARISNNEYLQPKNKEFFAKLGVDYLICPEQLASQEVLQGVKHTWLRQYLSFCDESLIMLGIKVRKNAALVNKKFNSGYFNDKKYRVVAISRKSKTIIPSGENQILADDMIYVMTRKEMVDIVREDAGKRLVKVRNVMIMGGSRIAQKTVRGLPENINVKLFERNKEKCYELSEKLNKALIINSDARDIDALIEEGAGDTDVFIAATSNSEANILACLEAKRLGIKDSIVEVENIDYLKLAEELGIGKVINKKLITASYIYQLTLDADVLDVKSLAAVDAEVVEFVAKEKSKITKNVIKKIRLPENVNFGGFVRDGQGYLVDGNTKIIPGDHVMVFTTSAAIRKVESLFK